MATSDAPLNVPNVTLAVARQAAPPVSSGSLLFKDNFSDYLTDPDNLDGFNIQMDKTPNYETLLAKGIRCDNSIRTTPRSLSEITGPGGDGTIAEAVSPVTNPILGAPSNDTVLRFRMNAAPSNVSTDVSYAELSWNLVDDHFYPQGEGTDEIWIQYDTYIPEHYHLRDKAAGTEFNGYDESHKVLVLHAGGYSGEHPTLILGAGPYNQDWGMPQENTMFVAYSMGGSLNTEGRWDGLETGQVLPIIYGDTDPGHWMRMTVRLKLPTAQDALDGIFEYYVQRHLDEPDSYTDLILREFAVPGWAMYEDLYRHITGGYIWGTYNTGYSTDVNYLVDNLIITDDPAQLADYSVTKPPVPQNKKTFDNDFGEGSTPPIRRPGGMMDGDTIIMAVIGSSNTLINSPNLIGGDGSGFTQIYSTRSWDSSARGGICAIFVKKVTDVLNEPYWYDLDFTGIYGVCGVLCMTSSGRGDVVNDTLVQETITSVASVQTSPIDIQLNGLTAREGDDLIAIAYVAREKGTYTFTQDSFTFPAGFRPEHKDLSNWESFAAAIKRDAPAGATGPVNFTYTVTDDTEVGVPHGVVIALPKEVV